MGLEVSHYDGQSLSLTAPLNLNDNDKGTAFGGSLYCAAVMAGWGYFYLRCRQYNFNEGGPNIGIGRANVGTQVTAWYFVCRFLLEKKKILNTQSYTTIE